MVKNAKFNLTPFQKVSLEIFGVSKLRDKFYWTGGTALAFFYLRHRFSNDIDFFSDEEFNSQEILPIVESISKKLRLKIIGERKIFDRREFLFKNGGKEMRLEFVHYKFGKLKPRQKWKNIFVDSLEDMTANKTMALIDRHDSKDAFDIYFLLKNKKFTPKYLLKLVEKKFNVQFPISLFWSEALTGANQLKNIKPLLSGSNQMIENQIKKIVSYFEKESARFVKQVLS
ncbi:MAG: nucleotidyl transferase AbiEii/AbiGii toxin family protein [Patescibacteria group bacterium]